MSATGTTALATCGTFGEARSAPQFGQAKRGAFAGTAKIAPHWPHCTRSGAGCDAAEL